MFMRVWLVLRVKRPEIMREGGHFHSCKSMLNTSLPLEQLPYPKQLYGYGSAQVNSDVGKLPRTGVSTELWTPAECPVRAGTGLDLRGQSLNPHLGSNYFCLWMGAWMSSHWFAGVSQSLSQSIKSSDMEGCQMHSMDIMNVAMSLNKKKSFDPWIYYN